MPKKLIHYTFITFLLTALTGVWMRLFVFTNQVHILDYDNILHAHSHVAILGWMFLAVFIIFLVLSWDTITQKKQAIALGTTAFFVTSIMFIAFLFQGYAIYSIIFSTIHIFVEYWMILFIFLHMKKSQTIPKVARYFMTGGLITLFISSIGPFALGALAASGLRESALFEMAIYFYLHFQYNGWLYLMLVGLFVYLLQKRGIKLQGNLLMISFWTYFIALFPGFFLSVLWYDFGVIGQALAIIGALGQLIGVVIFCYALWQRRGTWKDTFSKITWITFILTIGLLIIKTIMELGLLFPDLAAIVYDTRAVVIGYLHLTLLGFLTFFILLLFQLLGVIDTSKPIMQYGMLIFLVGFFLNEGVLFISGLLTWMQVTNPLPQNGLLLTASILLLTSIVLLWFSSKKRRI